MGFNHRRRWWAMSVLSIALLAINVDNGILSVALPTIARSLGATTSELQWIVDAYVLVFAGLLLPAGTLGDRFGRRRLLLLGAGVLGAGSIGTLFATTPAELIAIRGFMGIGAALICPGTLSIATSIFDDDERPKAIAMWAGVASMGLVIGPVVGGWLLERAPWTSVFLVNAPIAAFIVLAVLALVPESRDPRPGALDAVGASLSIVGLVALVFGIIEAPTRGWSNPGTIAWIGGGLAVLAAFVGWELRTRAPMLDVRLFALPRFGVANATLTLNAFAQVGSLFVFTQYLQFVLGYSPITAGVALLPEVVGLMVGAVIASRFHVRIGARLPVAIGFGLMALGLGSASTATTGSPYAFLGVILLVIGFGAGLAYIPATDSVMGSLPRARAGVGSAMNDTTRQLGSALGVAVIGAILASGYRDAITPALGALPAGAASLVRDSVGAADALASRIGGPAGEQLLDAARAAFVSGLGGALLVGAIAMLAAGSLALVLLPSSARVEGASSVGAAAESAVTARA